MDFERLDPKERALAARVVQAVCDGPFIEDAELQTVTGFSREELGQLHRRLVQSGKADEHVSRAIDQCLNNLVGYPHGMEHELEQLLGCSKKELEALASKWFGRAGFFERLQ